MDTSASLPTLPVLPTPGGVVLPGQVVTIALESTEARAAADAAGDDRLLLVPRHGDRFATVGTVVTIEDRGVLRNGTPALTVRALRRVALGAASAEPAGGLWLRFDEVDESGPTARTPELARRYRAVATALLEAVGGRGFAGSLPDDAAPGALADTIGYWPDLSMARRIELLETVDVDARLALATAWAEEALTELELTASIRDEVASSMATDQRQMLLRRQLAAIQRELGEGGGDVVAEYREKLDALDAPPAVLEAVGREIDRLERLGEQSQEASWIRTWLDEVFGLPFGERTDDHLDLAAARAVLDGDHTGLDDVKARVIEHLAVRKLQIERDVDRGAGGGSRAILALVGPPGVGKTSLGESVARALGRRFVRLALGGIRDEAEIRGHRRTYVGARPGRVARALAEAGTMNPVVLLDEIDKVGNDWRGDPSAALLEVLDPAQNHSFRDHYLEFELDLSDVLFIATANQLDTIPAPLLDRVEVIAIDGYSEKEKAAIARDHILPRLRSRIGLEDGEVVLPDEVIEAVVAGWTREAGVRGLERALDKLLRRAVTDIASGEVEAPVTVAVDDLRDALGRKPHREEPADRVREPGVATGLAVSGAGGDVLFVETSAVSDDTGLTLTGQLGGVMQESAEIARSWLRVHAGELGIDGVDQHLHIHFPAGGVPKDGPSAGITMTTALASLLSGRPVRPEVAMTGEISLQGRVLPVGGIKQKVLAAHRAGIREVILPAGNAEDLDDVGDEVLDSLAVHLVRDITEVLDLALSA